MGIPIGTEYIIPIVSRGTITGSINSNVVHQIDLSSKFDKISKYINAGNATNICVYRPDIDSVLTSHVNEDLLAQGNILLYFSSAPISYQDITYYVCFGKSINRAQAFPSSMVSCFFDCNEISETTLINRKGTGDGTILSGVEINKDGAFGRSIHAIYGPNSEVNFNVPIIHLTDITIDLSFKLDDFYNTNISPIIFRSSDGYRQLYISYLSNRLVYTENNGTNNAESNPIPLEQLKQWNHVCVTRTSTGYTKFYLNGIDISYSYDAGTPTTVSNLILFMSNATSLYLDEFSTSIGIRTQTYVNFRTQQIIYPYNFWRIFGGFNVASMSSLNTIVSSGLSIGF